MTTHQQQQLADVDAELEALEYQLQLAREKKAALAREREERERRELQQVQSTGKLEVSDLQRQIEELQRQLAQQEIEVNKVLPSKQPPITEVQFHNNNDENDNTHNYNKYQSQPSSTPPVKGMSEQAKKQHAWEKPAWALPSDVIQTDESIMKDSIQNPLLKAATNGYERKVYEADLAIIPGKFVKATASNTNMNSSTKIPKVEPRMVWIVMNIDGCKVGKIVMHLYGNFLPITDIFLELKGLEVFRTESSDTLMITDIEPNLYIHTGNTTTFTKKYPKLVNTVCYGIVLEGQDIFQQVMNASIEAVITVKQSHIYPVKKTK